MHHSSQRAVCKQWPNGLQANKANKGPPTPAPDIDLIGVALDSKDTHDYGNGGEERRIGVVKPWGGMEVITACTHWKIQRIQEVIQALTGVCCECQQLTYAGKVLPSHVSVLEAGLNDGCRVNLVVQPCKLAPSLLQLNIKPLSDVAHPVWVNSNHTIRQLKKLLQLVLGPHAEDQRLLFAGQQLLSEHKLHDYGLKQGYTLYLLIRRGSR